MTTTAPAADPGSAPHQFDRNTLGRPVYVNALPPPDRVSTSTLGQRSFLVIARLILSGGAEEWWPARTVRWVNTQVQVTFEPAAGEPVYVWLPAGDVRRTIHMPTAAGAVVDEFADGGRTNQLKTHPVSAAAERTPAPTPGVEALMR